MKTTRPCSTRATRGFTLMEVLIAMAVVALLAVVIIPGYTAQVQKSRRADAKTALTDLAAREERYYAITNAYSNNATNLGYSGTFPVAVTSSGVNSYSLNVALTATGFVGTATRAAGPQANDACGDYSLDDKGVQSNPNSTQTTPPCW